MRPTTIMPAFFFLLCFFLGLNLKAQQMVNDKALFVRIYNLEGKKVLKGRVAGVSDHTITLNRGGELREMDITDIGFIRTKHSVGNNVLIGATVGTTISAVAFAAAADPDAWIFGYTAAEGVLAGFILGAPLGGGIGALSALFKKTEQYQINGQQEEWMKIMPYFQK